MQPITLRHMLKWLILAAISCAPAVCHAQVVNPPSGGGGNLSCTGTAPNQVCTVGTLSATTVLAGVGGVSSSGQQPSGMLAFGDSTTRGTDGTNVLNADGFGWAYWFNKQIPGGVTNFGVGGQYATDVAQLQVFPQGCYLYGTQPPAVLNYGLNDRNYTTSYQWLMDQSADLANDTWLLIPCSNMVLPPSGAITKTGTWTQNSTRIGANAPTLEDATNGDTLSIPITTKGGPIIVWFEALDNNSGSATITIDGGSTLATLASGNSCPGLTGPYTSGLCIYTKLANTVATPQAQSFSVAAGTHTVLLTVTGATGSGMGFGFIGVGTTGIPAVTSTNPISTGRPTVYHTGLLRVPSYTPAGVDDTLDGEYQANITALQGTSSPIYYVCGLAGDYAIFPTSAIQPSGCADVTAQYLDNTVMNISTTAWSSVTSLLTVVLQGAVPASVKLGDQETISLVGTQTTLNTTTYWTVVSISGSTLTLANPAFSAVTWGATSDTAGLISKNFYQDPHPNGNGYFQFYRAINHYVNAAGGGTTPANLLNLNVSPQISTSYTVVGNEGVVQMNCNGTQTITMPTNPSISGVAVSTPTANGPIVIANLGSGYCTMAGIGAGGVPTILYPNSAYMLYLKGGATGTWVMAGSSMATGQSLTCLFKTANYTLQGWEPCIFMGQTTPITLTLPQNTSRTGNSPVFILNNNTANVTIATGTGAFAHWNGTLTLAPQQGITLFANGNNWYTYGSTRQQHEISWSIPTSLFSTSTMLGPSYYEFNGGTLIGITARLAGTISCTVAPTVNVLDLSTSVSTVYGSGTSLGTLATGTSDGAFTSIGLSAIIAQGHYVGVGFSAGTCVTAPQIDVTATIQ